MASALGRVATRQAHQVLLDIPLNVAFIRARGLELGGDGGVDTLRHKPFADPFHTPETGAQGQDDLVIPIVQLMGGIGHKRIRAWVSLRAAARPTETNFSNVLRSSVVRVTRYFAMAGFLSLGQ